MVWLAVGQVGSRVDQSSFVPKPASVAYSGSSPEGPAPKRVLKVDLRAKNETNLGPGNETSSPIVVDSRRAFKYTSHAC